MKKTALFLLLMMTVAATAFAESGRTTKGVWAREGAVLWRGAVNFLTSPGEIIRTPAAEKETYPKAWPLTTLPAAFLNVFSRLSSGVYDLIVYPIMVPFTDDLTPLTEGMGIPEYLWSDH